MSPALRYRLAVASRVLAAGLGGYALASAIAVLLSLLIPMQRAQAVMAATNLSFAAYAAIVCWVFHARSAARAWGWLAAWTAVVSALCWWLSQQAGAA